MNRPIAIVSLLAVIFSISACSRKASSSSSMKPTAFGAAVVESSGGKQIAQVGATLSQPLIVQVNDEQGNGVAGALVQLSAASGVHLEPATGLTDSSGQFTTSVTLGGMAGRYQITATTLSRKQKPLELKIEEIALGYQQGLGRQLNDQYCDRCHNPESTPERVSNYDNLEVKPHPFTEGETLNKLSEADLLAIISHGGPALNKSALMPPYSYTLSRSDIQALIAYIRAVSDPPYHSSGLVYAKIQ
jgi:mono/diheme cytochrome c family protein